MKKYTLLAFIFLALMVSSKTLALNGPISISVKQPQFGFAVIPSQTQRYYAMLTNAPTSNIKWSVGGGASISGGPFTEGWVDVQAPASGGNCTYSGTGANAIVSSPVSFTLTATSVDDPTKSNTITVNVCNPSVTLNIVPGYRVLYSGQQADIQSFILGSVNTNVTWSIINQPTGGDATLSDNANRDTVFSATKAGRYTVQAVSAADTSVVGTALLYVTGNPMPYASTPNGTEPVDCTVDPNSTGSVYDVGPNHLYKTIAAVPWTTLAPGSTVRIHNDDLTGLNPTTYNEYFNIFTQGTQANPIRVVGCPDAEGNLPVIDGTNATSNTMPNQGLVGFYGVEVYDKNWSYYGQPNTSPAWISIEGLKIENFNDTQDYTLPTGGAPRNWGFPMGGGTTGAPSAFVSGIRLQNGDDINVVGNDVTANGLGIFTESEAPESDMTRWILIEGNNFHANLKAQNAAQTGGIHTLYLQSFGQVVQGNYAGAADPVGEGGDFKDRGDYSFVRYNTFAGGADNTSRTVDIVDQQDANPYMNIPAYITAAASTDDAPLNFVAAWATAWHNYYFYGNVVTSRAYGPIHFNADHDVPDGVGRVGTLWYWANTGYLATQGGYDNYWFDGENPNLFSSTASEFPQIQSFNNIIWMSGSSTSTSPFFTLSRDRATFITSGGTYVPSSCCTNDQVDGGPITGWPNTVEGGYPATNLWYAGVNDLAAHLSGFGVSGSTIPNGLATIPFNPTNYSPIISNDAVPVPAAISTLPVRYQPDPAVGGLMVVRNDNAATVGAIAHGSGGNDTTPPTVSVTTPVSNATISGTVTLSANASDNVGVSYVQFRLDGANIGGLITSAPYTYTWDSTHSSEGPHILTAVAYDTANNVGTSAGIAVTLRNHGPIGWNFCASIYYPCSFTGTQTVAYGSGANYVYTPFKNGVMCEPSFFPSSTDAGLPACYLQASSTTPTPTPTPSPTSTPPTPTPTPTPTSTPTSTLDTTPPSIPAGLAAGAITQSSIALSWHASTDNVGVVGYKIYRNGTLIATSKTTSYASTGLSASTAYTYTVAAYDAAGNISTQSASVKATTSVVPPVVTPPSSGGALVPTAATHLTASNITASSLTLSWTAATEPGGGIGGYYIFSNGKQVGATIGTTFTQTGLVAGTAYTYTVSAHDIKAGISPLSQPITVTTAPVVAPTPAPVKPSSPVMPPIGPGPTPGQSASLQAPFNVKFTFYSSGLAVILTWSKATDPLVRYYAVAKSNAGLVNTPATGTKISSPSYIDTAVKPGQTYYYTLWSFSAGGATFSAPVVVKVTVPQQAAAFGSPATGNNGYANILDNVGGMIQRLFSGF